MKQIVKSNEVTAPVKESKRSSSTKREKKKRKKQQRRIIRQQTEPVLPLKESPKSNFQKPSSAKPVKNTDLYSQNKVSNEGDKYPAKPPVVIIPQL